MPLLFVFLAGVLDACLSCGYIIFLQKRLNCKDMNVPSIEALLDKETRLNILRELCEIVNDLQASDANNKAAMEATSEGDLYVKGVGGYDGTNAGEENVLTLQEVIEDLEG